jgi:hypothetical protein
MNTWTLTTTADWQHAIIGTADSSDQARLQLTAAARDAIHRADSSRPCYTLHIDGQLTAIIATGDDELGLPHHTTTAELLNHLDHPRNPFSRYVTNTGPAGPRAAVPEPAGPAVFRRERPRCARDARPPTGFGSVAPHLY